ncbi:MAG: alpha-L-fucosidase, partial [Planctomycetota bacterium]|nr:alpha-L-fucosidase [Planctomycetota bacterium]
GIPGYDWETCMTMNDTWEFKIDDHNWKSPEQLIRMLINIVSKGGNFLLNVGPTALGEIPPPSVERLKAIGDWMRVNGESIYGAGPSVFGGLEWGRCTTKPGKLYLHVFDWPSDGELHVPGLKNNVTSAHILGWANDIAVDRSNRGDDWIVHVPSDAPDPIATVIVLQIEGEPMVEASSTSIQENENAGQR